MALNKKQLAQYEEQLTTWRGELEHSLNQTIRDMKHEEQGSFPDPNDQASMETDRDFDLHIRDRERKLIKKINQAIVRIKEGTFGACSDCGGEIGTKRLQARPVTTLCIDCKTAQEIEERTRSD